MPVDVTRSKPPLALSTARRLRHTPQGNNENRPIQLPLTALGGLEEMPHCSLDANVAEIKKLETNHYEREDDDEEFGSNISTIVMWYGVFIN
eukprot:scaffold9102_cov157-Skeletonema_dohrnii-CCMP3373.AAC.7